MIQINRKQDNGCCKRKTRLEKSLLIYSFVVTVLAIIAVVFYFLLAPDYFSSRKDECTQKFCVKSAAEIFEFADLKKDPCADFYGFVCGSYFKNAVKKNTISPFVSIKDELQNEMKSIIVDPIRKRDINAQILLKQFYHECMDEAKINRDLSKTFLKSINELGGWPLLNDSSFINPTFHWLDWHIKSRKLGLPIIEFFTLKRQEPDDNEPVLEVGGVLQDLIDYIPSSKYESIMEQIINGLSNSSRFNKSENNEVHKFMRKLRELNYISNGEKEVKQLQDLQDACPFVPWLKFFNSIAQNEIVFTNSSRVSFGELGIYCKSLEKLIIAQEPRTIANFFVWSIIHQTYKYLGSNIQDAYKEIHWSTPSRYDICFEDADKMFKYVKETVYIRRRVSSEVKEDLTEMTNIMKEVLIEHLEAGDWMDERTKSLAVKKAAQIEVIIGASDQLYDEKYFDKVLGVDDFHFKDDNLFNMILQKNIKETLHFFRTLYENPDQDWPSYFENAVKPNAFFIPPLNIMIIPAPILSSIFYDARKPAFMNYGSIGRIIAHELMHGFEKTGRWVVFGNGMIDWWTNDSANGYDKKVQCLIDLYEKIEFRYKLNGSLTLDENVSDFVGIDIAYEAYLRWVKKYGPEQKLPGISLTPEQLYWIQTGTFLCFRKLDDNAIDFTEEDDHAIPTFRVEGGASNSLYFFKDYNCPEGSAMNPLNKCRIL